MMWAIIRAWYMVCQGMDLDAALDLGVHRDRDVLVTTDLMLCLMSIIEGKQAVSTFTLPYLSHTPPLAQ